MSALNRSVEVPVLGGIDGQERALAVLVPATVAPVHAYLFVGPPSSGKSDAARRFAAALLCHHGGDATCRDCVLTLRGEHPDVREVRRSGASISTEQADDIVHLASLAPVEGRRKVLVLHDFHVVAPGAAAKLLKTIEEPPPSAIFVVLADDVPPDLVTIASRCVKVEFVGRSTVIDEVTAERRRLFAEVATRLDGTGATVAALVAGLVAAIDASGADLTTRHATEAKALAEQIERYGGRGSGKKELEERHRREARRHRTDELKAGLATLGAAYRDQLVAGGGRHPAELAGAVARVHEAIEALDLNVNETLVLQALLLALPDA